MSDSFNPEKLPVWLRRTPEQQAADLALQDRLRQAQGPGRRPNPLERRLLQAASMKQVATAQLEHLRIDPHAKPEHIENAAAQMAEGLALEGNYLEAAELEPRPEHAARFKAIAHAIERDDNERCNCPIENTQDPATGEPITLTPDNVIEMIYSPKHRRLMPLSQCAACGDLQVKPATQQQEERMRRVRQEHTAARGNPERRNAS